MPTITKTWPFTSDSQSWVFSAVGTGNAGAWQSSGGDSGGDPGCLNNVTTGKTHSGTGHWDLTGTWASLFGVPAGAIVTQVGGVAGDKHWWKCPTFTTGAASTEGPFELRDAGGVLLGTFSTGNAYSATTTGASPAASAIVVPSLNQPAATTISLRLNGSVNTGNSTTANNTLLQDTVVLTVTYSFPVLHAVVSAREAADVMAAAAHVKDNLAVAATESRDTFTVSAQVNDKLHFVVTESADVFVGAVDVPDKVIVGATERLDVLAAAMTVSSATGRSLALATTEAPDVASVAGMVLDRVRVGAIEASDSAAVVSKVRAGARIGAVESADILHAGSTVKVKSIVGAVESADTMSGHTTVLAKTIIGATEASDILSMAVIHGTAPSGPPLRESSMVFTGINY